jgi:hypothetical protein
LPKEAEMDDFFALPAFKPAEALVQLKRQLRDLRPLAERGAGYEILGSAVIELKATDTTIEARLAKRPARSPEWTTHTLKNSADVRKFVDAVRQHLARWSDE